MGNRGVDISLQKRRNLVKKQRKITKLKICFFFFLMSFNLSGGFYLLCNVILPQTQIFTGIWLSTDHHKVFWPMTSHVLWVYVAARPFPIIHQTKVSCHHQGQGIWGRGLPPLPPLPTDPQLQLREDRWPAGVVYSGLPCWSIRQLEG